MRTDWVVQERESGGEWRIIRSHCSQREAWAAYDVLTARRELMHIEFRVVRPGNTVDVSTVAADIRRR